MSLWQRCVYLILKSLHGQNSLDFPRQFALLPHSSLSYFHLFCDNLRFWLPVISRMENNAPSCCVFLHQQCKNHFHHHVTLWHTLSILLAQHPELDTTKYPLCRAKQKKSLICLKNSSLVYASNTFFHNNRTLLSHIQFVTRCSPQILFEGLLLDRCSPHETWYFLSFSLNFFSFFLSGVGLSCGWS